MYRSSRWFSIIVAAALVSACSRTEWARLECGPVTRARPALVRTDSARAGELVGRVTIGYPGGRGLERAEAWLMGPRQGGMRTDSLGRFQFTELPPGRYVLRVRHLLASPRVDTLDLSAALGVALILPLAGTYPDECPNVLVPR